MSGNAPDKGEDTGKGRREKRGLGEEKRDKRCAATFRRRLPVLVQSQGWFSSPLKCMSWATQGCAPLFRSAITFSARRALAAGIRRSTCSAAEAVYFERRDDQPAPDPARCFDCPVDPAPAAQ